MGPATLCQNHGSPGQKSSSLCVLVERRIRGGYSVSLWLGPKRFRQAWPHAAPLAAQQGSLDAARLLLAHGADVDRKDAAGVTPLGTAVFNSGGAGDLIQLLRANGADAWSTNNAGQSPIGLARQIANLGLLG